MHSFFSNLSLFAYAIAKVAMMTGFLPGVAIAILIDKFGTGALRPEQSEPGHVSGVKLEFVSDSLLASSRISRWKEWRHA